MFSGLGRFVVRRPWWVIVGWLVVAFAIIATAPKLSTSSDQGSFLPSSYESIQAMKVAEKSFGKEQQGPSAFIAVKPAAAGATLTDADVAKITQIVQGLHVKN